jgi:flagellin
MIINHNMSAHFAHRQLTGVTAQLGESIEKLSSGYKINKAGDDASGLAVSEKLRSQIKGLAQAMRNAQNGISFLQTAEGSMQEMHSILHRMRELSIQGANQIYSSEDRLQIQVEVSQLKQEIDRIVDVTSFNQLKILDGSLTDLRFHVGPDKDQTIAVSIESMDTKALAVNGVDITSVAAANDSLGSIDSAVNTVSKQRANVGAWQNRMGHVVNTLAITEENLTAAESRIRDTDMAREIIEFTKNDILTQTGTAMLVQANMQSKTVLKLLG